MNYKVILYYNFTPIANLSEFCRDHKKKCQALNLKGRVLIAKEGINGTLAGTSEEIKRYQEYLCSLPGFEQTEFKEDTSDYLPFVKLTVKSREEIVALKPDVTVDVTKEKAPHLSPKQWREKLEKDQDYILLDVRNNYESAVGRFKGAICPDVENFFDFPQWLNQSNLDKNKPVLMYCTGGIRCEKFSIYMKNKGFKDIYQLDGGIINYGQKEGGAHFEGKCFVFDDRLTVDVSIENHLPLTRCLITDVPCDKYLNCANPDCNKLFICSEEGATKMQGCCSEECLNSPRRRPFDPHNIYAPSRKWYNYFVQKP